MVVSPLTGRHDVTLLHTIQAAKLIADWQKFYQIDVKEEFQGQETIYLYQCNETELKFFYPLDIVARDHIYKQLQQFKWYYMSKKWEFRFGLRNLCHRETILEIGSGFGAFIKLASDHELKVSGIELNEEAVKIAKAQGLSVELISLDALAKRSPASFDAVCSFQVLEHVSNPREFIASCVKILKPGGKLILSVPNCENYLKYQYNLLNMPPHHMTQWSKAAFISLEQIFPVKVEKITYEPLATYHISGYLQTYRDYFVSFSRYARIFLNRYTMKVLEKMLMIGPRHFLRGHTIYAQFRKQ